MRETKTNLGEVVGWATFSGRGIRSVACLLLLWCGAFLASQCHALSIRAALGMIESGDDDHAVGSAGEISRYQIKKGIWRAYSSSANYCDQNEAWRIAQKILAGRIEEYHRQTRRAPAPFDIYVLWNAPGQFQSVGYQPKRLSQVVAERATRFANLVQRAEPSAIVARGPNLDKGRSFNNRSEGAPQFDAGIAGMN